MDLYDVNCFIGGWPQENHPFHTKDALLREMDRLRIGSALVRHTEGWWYDPASGNEKLVGAIRGEARLRPCLAATPLISEEMGGPHALRSLLRDCAAGAVCLYPRSQNFTLAAWCAGPLLDMLQDMAMPIIIQMEETDWAEVQSVLEGWPQVPLILTRVGYRCLRMLLPLLQNYPTLHVDISYLADNQALEVIAERIGVSQLLFGTGTPMVDGSGAVARLAYSGLAKEERKQVGSSNFQRLLSAIHID